MPRRLPATRPAAAPRTVAVLAWPGMESLDVTGPISVFAGANRLLARRGEPPAYALTLLGPRAGPVPTGEGIAIIADRAWRGLRQAPDTLLVAGGPDVEGVLADVALIAWLRRIAPRVRRIGSVCSGAFLLAEAGLLDGRRATTHWAMAALFAARYPAVRVDAEPIYLRDGAVWTSAGVTAGMDLALALVEEDCGRDLALQVARALVLYLRRPGGQSQFSTLLATQAAERSPIAALQLWLRDHLAEALPVEVLAQRAAMSPRNFARVFRAETGLPPARFVERLRVEEARRRLEQTQDGVKAIAGACGFGTPETMRAAFLRNLRVPPSTYRTRFEARDGGGRAVRG